MARSIFFLLAFLGGAMPPTLARADAALYIFHGLNSEAMPASGVELVCLGRAPKVRSCRAARTTDGVVKQSAVVEADKGRALIEKFSRQLKPGGGGTKAACRGSLSYSREWNEQKTTRALCSSVKQDREATHVLLKAEHAITGLLGP